MYSGISYVWTYQKTSWVDRRGCFIGRLVKSDETPTGQVSGFTQTFLLPSALKRRLPLASTTPSLRPASTIVIGYISEAERHGNGDLFAIFEVTAAIRDYEVA